MSRAPTLPERRKTAARPGRIISHLGIILNFSRKAFFTVRPTPATPGTGPGDHHEVQPSGLRQVLLPSFAPCVSVHPPTSCVAISLCTCLDFEACFIGSAAKRACVFQLTMDTFPEYCPLCAFANGMANGVDAEHVEVVPAIVGGGVS